MSRESGKSVLLDCLRSLFFNFFSFLDINSISFQFIRPSSSSKAFRRTGFRRTRYRSGSNFRTSFLRSGFILWDKFLEVHNLKFQTKTKSLIETCNITKMYLIIGYWIFSLRSVSEKEKHDSFWISKWLIFYNLSLHEYKIFVRQSSILIIFFNFSKTGSWCFSEWRKQWS